MNSDLLHGFYLGDVLIDPVKGYVTGPSGPLHLPPKAMEVLLVLASNPGALVTRNKLIDEVWGKGRGTQEALNHAVSEIRQALDDHADDPVFIQTLPKRGYRLISEVELASAHSTSVVIGAHNRADDIGLFENIKQRGVLETAFAYLLLGWLLIQVADIVFAQLRFPDWTGTFVTALVIAGLPIAVILAWFLEFRDGRGVLHELSPSASRRKRFTRTYVSVIGALGISAIVVFVYDQSVGLPQSEITRTQTIAQQVDLPPVQENSIAVLPLLNVDGSERTQVFSNGLADDVITRLTRVPGLLVSSRGDSFTLAPNSGSSRVRERLRVALYLEGSVEIIQDEMRVIVQLIDSASGFHVLSKSFDRPLSDYFDMRDEITELIVANVRVALPVETQVLASTEYEESDLNAYILYRTGKEIFERPRTLQSIAESISNYEKALALDSHYTAAHAGLCDAYVARFELSSSVDDIKRAEQACGAALESNARLHMVHTALGQLYLETGRIERAAAAFQEALAIHSTNAQALIGLSEVYVQQNRMTEAEEILHQAIGAEPGNWRTIDSLGGFYFNAGRYDEAANLFRQVVHMEPNNFEARSHLGSALTMAGDFEAGKVVFAEALQIQPSQRTYSNLGVIYYYLGEFDDSVAMHRKAVELSPGIAVMWTNLADALYFLGNTEESASAYRQAAEISRQRLAANRSDTESLINLAWSEHMLGNTDAALDLVARALSIAANDPYSFYYDALIKNRSGDTNGALESLQTALQMGYPAEMLMAEPLLGDLRNQARFKSMLADFH